MNIKRSHGMRRLQVVLLFFTAAHAACREHRDLNKSIGGAEEAGVERALVLESGQAAHGRTLIWTEEDQEQFEQHQGSESRHLAALHDDASHEHPDSSAEAQEANSQPEGQRVDSGTRRDMTHVRREHHHGGGHGHPVVFVGVLTSSWNVEKRMTIRETWGADRRFHRVMFFLSTPRDTVDIMGLQREAVEHGDISMEPHILQGYPNITHQTLDMMRTAVVDRAVTHLLKVDDDTYVQTDAFFTALVMMPREHLMLGFIPLDPGGPSREDDNPSPWSVSREEWPREKYAMWADGGCGYVLTRDLVAEIAAGSAQLANGGRILGVEDVMVGAWVEYVALDRGWSVHYMHHDGFDEWAKCNLDGITFHRIQPEQMRCMFAHNGAVNLCCEKSS